MLLFTLAIANVTVTASLAVVALRLNSLPSLLLGAYILAVAEIVLVTELLSIAGAVGAAGYLLASVSALVVVATAWHIRGRPLPGARRVALPQDPILAALALVVLAALAYSAFLALATPPNNWDSMTYHLSRVAGWHQQGAVAYLDAAHTERQNAFPPNAEILILFTVAFVDRDTLAVLPQLVAFVAALVGVYGIAVRLGFERAAAVGAALLTATLAQPALQAVTTQNDIVVAAFAAAAAYFVLSRLLAELALAGVAIGLMIGTKPTAVLVLPVLLLLAGVSLTRRHVAAFVGASAVGVALVGSYGYVLNAIETGSPLGDASAADAVRPTATTAGGVLSTILRTAYRFLDLSGFHWGTGWTSAVADAAERITTTAGIPPNPPESTGRTFYFDVNVAADSDLSFFGPLGLVVVLPLAAGYVVVWALRRTDARRGALALALPVSILSIAFAYRYNDFVGRFLSSAVILTMPLAAQLYGRRLVFAAAAVLGAVSLALVHVTNAAKPTGALGSTPVWELSRAEAQGLTRRGMSRTIGEVERRLPRHACVGVVLGEDEWDYPLYGEHLDRTLVLLEPTNTLEHAKRSGVPWVVAGSGVGLRPKPGWTIHRIAASGWKVAESADVLERCPNASVVFERPPDP